MEKELIIPLERQLRVCWHFWGRATSEMGQKTQIVKVTSFIYICDFNSYDLSFKIKTQNK